MWQKTILLIITLALVSPAFGQESKTLYTRPALPSAESLERLSLQLAWYKKVPMIGMKDGIDSFKVIPGEKGDDVLIQTRGGVLQLMDAETGDLKWRTPIGFPFKFQKPPGYNSHSIYTVQEGRLFALNRKNGYHRLFWIDYKTETAHLGFPISNPPSAELLANEAAVYIPSDQRIVCYVMPKVNEEQLNLPPVNPSAALPSAPIPIIEPKFQGTYISLGLGFSRPLAIAGESLVGFSEDGALISINIFSLAERFKFKTFGVALAGMGHYADMAYVGSSDSTVYAIHMLSGKLRWRFLGGSPIIRTPQATEKDVFITTAKLGLSRLDRDFGNLIWNNKEAQMFLAMNEKFVYAMDTKRNFLVLDYLKGTTLSRLDTRDFVMPISNTLSDRIYLANHDGTVICMHHTKNQKPYRPSPNANNGEPKEEEPMPKKEK